MRHAIFLLGPPGAGFARMVQALERLGLGAAEHVRAAPGAFSARILARAGRQPLDPKPVSPIWIDPREQPLFAAHAAGLLRDALLHADAVALTDPCIGRTLPIWRNACTRAGVTPVVILLAAKPEDVAASLAVDAGEAALVWLAHMIPAEEASRPLPRIVLDGDMGWEDASARLHAALVQLGVPLPPLDPAAAAGAEAPPRDHGPADLAPAKAAHQPFSILAEELHQNMRRSLGEDRLDRGLWNRGRGWLESAWSQLSPGDAASGIGQDATIRAGSVTPADPVAARHVIFHYHLFKNAGTSLDHALKAHFGPAWEEREGGAEGWRPAEIADFAARNPQFAVLSSHTALLPVPKWAGLVFHPLLFLRHPLDRVRSIHAFERRQPTDTEGSILARTTDLRGYVHERLTREGDRSIRNFQTYRLAHALPPTEGNEWERAVAAFASLPLVGVVERYDASLKTFEAALAQYFPAIKLKPTQANVSQRPGLSLEQRLVELRAELGDELYAQLEEANQADLALHRLALARYQAEPIRAQPPRSLRHGVMRGFGPAIAPRPPSIRSRYRP